MVYMVNIQNLQNKHYTKIIPGNEFKISQNLATGNEKKCWELGKEKLGIRELGLKRAGNWESDPPVHPRDHMYHQIVVTFPPGCITSK